MITPTALPHIGWMRFHGAPTDGGLCGHCGHHAAHVLHDSTLESTLWYCESPHHQYLQLFGSNALRAPRTLVAELAQLADASDPSHIVELLLNEGWRAPAIGAFLAVRHADDVRVREAVGAALQTCVGRLTSGPFLAAALTVLGEQAAPYISCYAGYAADPVHHTEDLELVHEALEMVDRLREGTSAESVSDGDTLAGLCRFARSVRDHA